MINKKNVHEFLLVILFFNIFLYKNNFYTSCPMTCFDKLSLVYLPGVINVPNLLKYDIYKNTNNITMRDLTSIPSLLRNFNLGEKEDKNLKLNLFFSTIPNGIKFDKDNESLTSILNISNFSNNNQEFFNLLALNPSYGVINFQLMENVFDYIKIQQNRVGGILEGSYLFNEYQFYLQIPVVYQIHNINIDYEIQEVINNEFFILNDKSNKESSFAKDFLKEHFVIDFFGIDRPFFGVKKNLFKGFEFELFAGIPIGFEFSKGLIGGDFYESAQKKFDFSLINYFIEIINSSPCKEEKEGNSDFLKLFSSMLEKIASSAFYLPFSEKPLSVGSGFTIKIDLPQKNKLIWSSRFSYNFDYEKINYGYNPVDINKFNLKFDTKDEKTACSILNFLDDQFLKRILLVPFFSTISRPFEFQNILFLNSITDDFEIRIGSDFWYRSAENIFFKKKHFVNESAILNDLKFALAPSALQFSIFGNLNLFREINDKIYIFGINGTIPLISSGIGNEYTISINLETNF